MPSSRATASATALRVARQHHHLDADVVQPPHRLGATRGAPRRPRRTRRARARLRRGRPSPCPRAGRFVGEGRSAGRWLDAELREQVRPADGEPASIDERLHAVPRNRLEAARRRDPRRSRSSALLTIARATGCSASLLDGGGETERARRRATSPAVRIATTRCSPSVSVPVLSNTTVVHAARLLEAAPVAHQEPVPRAERGRDRDDERHREAERVRTGDDEHRHHALDRERGRGAERETRRPRVTQRRRRWRRS